LSTTPPANLPTSPTIPLSDELHAAYNDLLNSLQAQYQSSADPAVRGAIGPLLYSVDDILTKDNMYKLSQDTAIFAALQTQITSTNQGLQTLQAQIGSTDSRFSMAGDILAGITKVLTFFS
jgi:hypothetical protein